MAVNNKLERIRKETVVASRLLRGGAEEQHEDSLGFQCHGQNPNWAGEKGRIPA